MQYEKPVQRNGVVVPPSLPVRYDSFLETYDASKAF